MLNLIRHGTCNTACWEAREDVCRCMCGGRNHGITRHGGERPGRYCQRKGVAYTLEAITVGRSAYSEAERMVDSLRESQPKIAKYGYHYWDEGYAFAQSVPPNARKWPEVIAVAPAVETWGSDGDIYLVWRRISLEHKT